MNEVTSNTPEATWQLGYDLAARLSVGNLVLLDGELGAGKTVFVKGIAAGLGYNGLVTSPTFTLLREYETNPPLYHLDLYRLSTDAVEELGIDEYRERGIVAVEWADRALPVWSKPWWYIKFTLGAELEERTISITEESG